jgi:hypothetical protein
MLRVGAGEALGVAESPARWQARAPVAGGLLRREAGRAMAHCCRRVEKRWRETQLDDEAAELHYNQPVHRAGTGRASPSGAAAGQPLGKEPPEVIRVANDDPARCRYIPRWQRVGDPEEGAEPCRIMVGTRAVEIRLQAGRQAGKQASRQAGKQTGSRPREWAAAGGGAREGLGDERVWPDSE